MQPHNWLIRLGELAWAGYLVRSGVSWRTVTKWLASE